MKKTSKYLVFLIGLVALFLCLSSLEPSKAQINASRADSSLVAFSQQSDMLKPVPQMIRDSKSAGANFERRPLFQSSLKVIDGEAQLREVLSDGVILDLNRPAIEISQREDLGFLTLPLPDGKGGTIELELVKVNIFAPGFSVKTSEPTNEPIDENLGIHYRGIVKGDDRSLAAISIFKNEVMGFYSTEADGNSILGRLGGDNPNDLHVLYAEKDLKVSSNFSCDTEDTGVTLPESILQAPAEVAARCVRIYIEANFDLFQNKGSVANTTSYLTGMFNQSATLFSNDGIAVSLSEVFVWTSTSPYNGANSEAVLIQFRNLRTSFNGDLAHLITLNRQFGGIAYVDTLCNSFLRYGLSDIDPTFNNVPIYSWTVYVFTHETGHNLGSRHTHACAWNGNNTPIDGCAPPEGSCSQPGIPSGGGTIMSYCHLQTVGINFTLGFGTQPRNLILNRFNAASCLSNCSTTNDNCSNAILLISNTACSYTSGTVLNATASGLPKPSCDVFSSPNMFDVWYKFTATSSSQVVTVDPSTAIGDPVVSVYSSCTGSPIGCSDGDQGVTESLPLFGLTVGNTYYVRIYDFGSIEPTGSNADFQICVTGTEVTPTITVSTTSLSDFGNVAVGQNSAPQSYTVSGSNLLANISTQAPTGFQISLSSTSGFTNTLTLTRSGGSVPTTTIFARFSPQASGAQSGNISHTSSGATTRNVFVSGTGTVISDLIVTSLTAPISGSIGGQITVSVTASNQGSGNAGAFRLGLYFSTDSTITTGDTFTAFCDIPSGLAAGTPVTCEGQVGVPSFLAPGTYYVGAIADYLGQVGESNEANNARPADTGPITLTGSGGETLLLSETFSGGIPPTWSVIDGGSGGGAAATWTTGNPGGRFVDTPFSGAFAIVDSDIAANNAVQDEQLITPVINAAGCGQVILEFTNQFQWYNQGLNEIADVDVSTNGGATWTNVLRLQGANDGYPTPNTKSLNITSAIGANRSNVRVRFHYYNANFEWWWAIDNVKVRCLSATGSSPFDFDGDGSTDIAVFRPSDAFWFILQSSDHTQRPQQWGISTDKLVPGDYDGDGRTDIAVFRPSNGVWYILQSTSGFMSQQFAAPGDVPVPGDYDGDGKTDIAVFHPSDGTWRILKSSDHTQRVQQWGASTDKLVPADYDGDGTTDIAVFRPSNGVWYILQSSNGFSAQQFAAPGDIPVPGDYDGDGKADIAVFHPSDGYWFILKSSDHTQTLQQWGASSDKLVPGDYDGDGRTDIAVFRPSNGVWYILQSSNGFAAQQFAVPGDLPVPSAYIQ